MESIKEFIIFMQTLFKYLYVQLKYTTRKSTLTLGAKRWKMARNTTPAVSAMTLTTADDITEGRQTRENSVIEPRCARAVSTSPVRFRLCEFRSYFTDIKSIFIMIPGAPIRRLTSQLANQIN